MCRTVLFACLILRISLWRFETLASGKYFSINSFASSFHVVMDLDGRSFNHYIVASSIEKRNALNFIWSSMMVCGFILKQTTWNSLRNLCTSSFSRLRNVGRKCINPDLSSKFWAVGKVIQIGWWVTYCVAYCLRVLSLFSAPPMFNLSESYSYGHVVLDSEDDDGYVSHLLWVVVLYGKMRMLVWVCCTRDCLVCQFSLGLENMMKLRIPLNIFEMLFLS